MACTHPLKGFVLGVKSDGKRILRIVPYEVDYLFCDLSGNFHCYQHADYSGSHIMSNGQVCFEARSPPVSGPRERLIMDCLQIPCGQCEACRLQKSRDWANRCMLELEYHTSSYFVTLTYDDDHVPTRFYADPADGEVSGEVQTLVKKDFQDFLKRLRKRFKDQKIRYYACGEYGPATWRPHFHAILFGLQLDDLQVYERDTRGYTYYTSQSLSDVWSIYRRGGQSGSGSGSYESLGRVVVGQVTWETCAYTARYILKKLTGPYAKFYEDFNLEPPFTLMSTNPGLARQWYDDHPDVMDYEYISIKTPTGGRKFRPPRYYDRLFDVDDPEASAVKKELRRKMAEQAQAAKLSRTSMSYLELLAVEEHQLKNRIKKLERKL
ncbi:replication initiator protein [Sigmofec virus UA08Rod_5894]|uniref:Replication initiator protein n=1 Tax=Sigmofec virus UA08Rod_5894 TaxID=2929443 RepID=A0A976N130_9VIRU|nr:replication initiator protein [Sigmofec virus UA08Rod_5894]